MYELAFSKSFKKSIKRLAQANDYKVVNERLEVIIEDIKQRKTLGLKYRDHALHGAWVGYRECHIRPDVLLLYEIDDNMQMVTMVNIGSHSELFG